MPLTLTWHEIALRLALSVVAGGLIGWDRGEHGRPAGLRTTLLVCLAAGPSSRGLLWYCLRRGAGAC
jgi:putative Mg2+ transporter-C (MgtC) family protein